MQSQMTYILDSDFDNITDPILRSFLNTKSNYELFIRAKKHPCGENISKLNRAFKKHYTEIQLISYISQLINHYSRDFYRKKSREKYFYVYAFENEYILDNKNFNQQLENNTQEVESLIEISSLLEAIQDQTIYETLIRLTDRQLLIINLHFVHQLSHTEIAEKLKVSQQSISKTIKKILNKLRDSMETGGN
ncbi:sigma-70 family RNA polymerase sigma factor [Alkalibacillus silvisoli]|uniref:RNA polymerase sigma-70 region 4 domain-containing protein n=1 Tax=Alkalibacillus silvisoli TaxID=392823 RepID=A0ABN1A030_9BACI